MIDFDQKEIFFVNFNDADADASLKKRQNIILLVAFSSPFMCDLYWLAFQYGEQN